MMNLEHTFLNIYKRKNEFLLFCPYRVCPLGAHVDHQLGKVTGFAIDKGVSFAYSIKHNGVIEVNSLQFDKRAQWHILSVPEEKQNDWANHLRGITLILGNKYRLKYGLCGVFNGDFPIGGLSSSAAISICFLLALTKVNNIELSDEEIIEIAKASENNYVGVSCGTLDQSCITYCKKDHILYLDTKTNTYSNVLAGSNMKPWKIAIFFSGVERNLASSKYNMRVDETKSAAYALEAYSNAEYGKFKDAYLGNVSKETYNKYKDKLPDTFRKRAEHFYSEIDRVEKGIKCWENGDIISFGKLVSESGYSSIYNYETGSDELKTLYEILINTKGVYGARFSGAGFKGSCIAIIDPNYENEILETVKEKYLSVFPQYKDKYVSSVCNTVDGAGNK